VADFLYVCMCYFLSGKKHSDSLPDEKNRGVAPIGSFSMENGVVRQGRAV
jgi:hypothetical protein